MHSSHLQKCCIDMEAMVKQMLPYLQELFVYFSELWRAYSAGAFRTLASNSHGGSQW